MTEEDNTWIALLGIAGAAVLAFLGLNTQKANSASSSMGQIAPPKAKTGCGCGH